PQLLSSFLFTDKFTSKINNEREEDLIEKSIDYMQKNMDKSITLEILSKYINTSTSHYSAIFKKKIGFPPIEYLNHLKIQKACQYLQFTKFRVKEIALKIGIEDQYYFSRLFTKIMGVCPSDYREQRGA